MWFEFLSWIEQNIQIETNSSRCNGALTLGSSVQLSAMAIVSPANTDTNSIKKWFACDARIQPTHECEARILFRQHLFSGKNKRATNRFKQHLPKQESHELLFAQWIHVQMIWKITNNSFARPKHIYLSFDGEVNLISYTLSTSTRANQPYVARANYKRRRSARKIVLTGRLVLSVPCVVCGVCFGLA